MELWQKLIDLQPNNASAYFNMGFSHLKLKNYEEALRVSKKALELNPDLKEAVLNYANSELVIGDIDRAITSLSNVLQRVPDYPPAIGLLAASLFVKGHREKALGHFKKLDKMGYDCADYLYDLADMLASERRDKEAVQLLEAAIESNNTHPRHAIPPRPLSGNDTEQRSSTDWTLTDSLKGLLSRVSRPGPSSLFLRCTGK